MSKRKKPIKKRARLNDSGKRTAIRSRELIVIDNGPIRHRAVHACKKVMKDVEKARREIDRHEKKDGPAFSMWLNANFGAQLTELRELNAKGDDLMDFIGMIQNLKYANRISFFKAWKMASEIKADPAKLDEYFSSGDQDFEPDYDGDEWCGCNGASDDGDDPFLEEAIMEEFLDMLASDPALRKICRSPEAFERYFSEFKEYCSSGDTPDTRIKSGGKAAGGDMGIRESRVKEIYRTLVRKLHPDYRKDWNAGISNIWNEVQEAYRDKNLERLQTLAAKCDIHSGLFHEGLSISQLNDVIQEYKEQLRQFRHLLKNARRDIAWNFSRVANTDRMHSRVKRDVTQDIKAQKSCIAEMESTIDRWSKPPARGGKNRTSGASGNKKKPNQDDIFQNQMELPF